MTTHYTHHRDGNSESNYIPEEGAIATTTSGLKIGDGVTPVNSLPNYPNNVIASATIDLNVAGTTELTYATGVNGRNFNPTGLVIYASNPSQTYTEDASQDDFQLNFNGFDWGNQYIRNENFFAGGVVFTYGGQRMVSDLGYGVSQGGVDANRDAETTSKWTFVVGAVPPSSTPFEVKVLILGQVFETV